jgi:hypothetical protein
VGGQTEERRGIEKGRTQDGRREGGKTRVRRMVKKGGRRK